MTLQKTSHTFREQAQLVQIGMQASGSYVCAKFNSDAYSALTRQDFKALSFEKAKSISVVTSDREAGKAGCVARVCNVSTCGKFVRYADNSIMALDVLQDFKVYSLADFVSLVLKAGVVASVQRVEARQLVGEAIHGFVFGSLAESYSTLVYALNGKVQVKDIEIRANEYNAHELVCLVDMHKAAERAEELASKLRKAAGMGEVENVAKAKKSAKAKKTAGAKAKKSTKANADSSIA